MGVGWREEGWKWRFEPNGHALYHLLIWKKMRKSSIININNIQVS